jgi:hypothetical protein
MSRPLVDRIPFAKIVTILAIVFGVALGLCGATLGLANSRSDFIFAKDQFLIPAGIIEIIVMALSAVGLLVTVIAWVVLGITSGFSRSGAEPQKLFDDENEPRKRD